MPPLYKWFYPAQILAGIAFTTHLIQVSILLSNPNSTSFFSSPLFTLLFYHLPLAIAATIGLVITWKYWSWLITEHKS